MSRRYEDGGLAVGLLVGVGPDEPLADRLPLEVVSDGVAEGLELSLGEPDSVGVDEELSVGVEVGVEVVAVAVGELVGVGDAVDVPVSVGVAVAVGVPVAVGLGVLDGAVDGQAGAE
ncbi:hypothetical protein EAS64_34560 [Trebonia kvetii]|uniref:Uncharacterized protein n=1 Tax=Trebonia kvetii TaxID=2480626 RepID=A0A6P2BTG7_9ACTN|nr:hypothetical protein [Trebonia kvetii]TVZ01385.1 hypothetical protein EAS64_34560 [Trebonia kvetii]